jgi:menaquinone-dependent protoporphyrinogen oxidase
MTGKILITFASRNGSTAGVAATIGKTLEDNGIRVDVLAMDEVEDLEPYSAIVAGSAIRSGQWLPEAVAFMHAWQESLKTRPLAIFTVCMTLAMPGAERFRKSVSAWLEPVRYLVKPVKEGYFAGKLDINQVRSFRDRFKFRLSVMFGIWKEGDHRDWNAIQAWAKDLHTSLLQ